jgi:hypothetical protein
MKRQVATTQRMLVHALLLAAACGGVRAPKKKVVPLPEPQPPVQPEAPDASDAGPADAQPLSGQDPAEAPECASAPQAVSGGMGVKGITGSLNRGDVHQVMETRFEALMECMNRRPRGLRWVGGRIDFLIKVGADGRVCEARPVRSTIGYRPLELCLTEVVEQTPLPPPDGRDRTEVDWGMNVEPDRGRETPFLKPAAVENALKRYADRTYKACEVPRRMRFEVTAYTGRSGKVLAAGVVPLKSVAPDKLECLLEEIKVWRLPPVKRRSKVAFTLKWKPPPPKSKRYAGSKRGKSSRGRKR